MTDLSHNHLAAHAQLSTGEPPTQTTSREPAGQGTASRTTTPGRCNNLDYCSLGMQRVLIPVPVRDQFVCPECGHRLRPPVTRFTVRQSVVMPVLRLAVLVVGMTTALCVGFSLGHVQPVVSNAVASVSEAARRAIQPLPPPAVAATPAPLLVAERPFPKAADAVPPTHLSHEARFGQVTIDCALPAATTQPACHLADLRGGDAFSAGALDWLRHLTVQYAPGTRTLPDHRWRMTFQDFTGTQKRQ